MRKTPLYSAPSLALLACAAASLMAAPAHAQTSGQTNGQALPQTEAITVYATRSPQPAFGVPAMVSQLDADAPGHVLAHTLSDLLATLPSVNLFGGPRRNGQTLSVRGFDDEAIVTLLDGRRQNFESQHDGRMFVDPALLKSVELVRGASSAVYGGGAVGGVAAYETKDAADLLAPGQNAGAFVAGGYRSGNMQGAVSLAGYARSETWDVVSAFAWRESDNIRQGGGGELITDERLLSGMIKLGVNFAEDHTLKFQSLLFNNQGREPNNGQIPLRDRDNPLVDKDVRDNQLSLKYAYANPDQNWLAPSWHLYYNNSRVDEQDVSGTNTGRDQTRLLETVGFTLDNVSVWSFSAAHTHRFAYGFEIYSDRQDGRSSTTGARAGVPDAEALNYGFYLQDEVAVQTPVGDFLLIPAVRVDSYNKEDSESRDQNRTQFSPKVSLSYAPLDEVMVFASWAQAFRAPNLTETFASGLHFPGGVPDVAFGVFCRNLPVTRIPVLGPDGRPVIGPRGMPQVTELRFLPDNQFVPNPDLKPETVSTVEVGAGLRGGARDGALGRAELKGAWFRSEGRNFITQNVDACGGETQFRNIPNALLSGWEVELTYAWRWLNLRLAGFGVEAEDSDTGAYLPNNVPLTLVTDVSFVVERFDSVLGWRARFADDYDRVADNDENDIMTAGYAVNDIYWRWRPRYFGPRTPVQLDFSIENLLDESYQKRASPLTEEGRSFNLRLEVKW